MSILYEDSAIAQILSDLLDIESHHAMLVIAWSERGTLVLKPEFSVLTLPETEIVRLPVPYPELSSTVTSVASLGVTQRYVELQYPLYQLHSGMELLAQTLLGESSVDVSMRLREIRRFTMQHWGSPTARVIDCIRDNIFDQERAASLCLALRNYASSFSWLAFTNLFDLASNHRAVILDSIDALEAVVVSAPLLQACLPRAIEQTLACHDRQPWWKLLQQEVSHAQKTLECWGAQDFSPDIYETARRASIATGHIVDVLEQWSISPPIDHIIQAKLGCLQQGLAEMRQELDTMHNGYAELQRNLIMLAKG